MERPAVLFTEWIEYWVPIIVLCAAFNKNAEITNVGIDIRIHGGRL
jgi:hypothetical protein